MFCDYDIRVGDCFCILVGGDDCSGGNDSGDRFIHICFSIIF